MLKKTAHWSPPSARHKFLFPLGLGLLNDSTCRHCGENDIDVYIALQQSWSWDDHEDDCEDHEGDLARVGSPEKSSQQLCFCLSCAIWYSVKEDDHHHHNVDHHDDDYDDYDVDDHDDDYDEYDVDYHDDDYDEYVDDDHDDDYDDYADEDF